jgi:molybdopterin converting factor small subunit
MRKRFLSLSETVSLPPNDSSMGVNVRLIGVLASAAGERDIRLSVSGPQSVAEFVSRLLEVVGKRQFTEFLVDSGTGDPRPNVIILLDEQDCNLFGGLNAVIQPKSIVTIIPVAHGG